MELTLKEHFDRLFNIACKHGIYPVCDSNSDGTSALEVTITCDYINKAVSDREAPQPIEVTYVLGNDKRNQLKNFLLEEGISAEDVDKVSNLYLLKRALSTLDHSANAGIYGDSDLFKAKVRLAVISFIETWSETFVTTAVGKSVMAALDKFNELNDKIIHNELKVTIVSKP